jgi:hypothetical protein
MNPTGQPLPGTPMPSAPQSAAKDAVNLPSLFIMILGGLAVLLFLSSLFSDLSGGDRMLIDFARSRLDDLPPELRNAFREALDEGAKGSRVGSILQNLVGIVTAALTVFGGLQMRRLKSWGLALTSALLVFIPCGSHLCCCCGLGPAVGIWALVMLTKPEVKSAFS